MSMRDHHREHDFLTAAAGGHPAFVEHATARLELGQPIYGDSWQWIGIRRHLRELTEEAADLGAWAALADQALDTTDMPDTERIRAVLRSVARNGGQAHALLTPMLRALDALCERTLPEVA